MTHAHLVRWKKKNVINIFTFTYFRSIKLVRESFHEDKTKQAGRENSYRVAIRYELHILALMRERSELIFRSDESGHQDLAKMMESRIRNMYESALLVFSANYSLRYEYYRFLANCEMWEELSKKLMDIVRYPVSIVWHLRSLLFS